MSAVESNDLGAGRCQPTLTPILTPKPADGSRQNHQQRTDRHGWLICAERGHVCRTDSLGDGIQKVRGSNPLGSTIDVVVQPLRDELPAASRGELPLRPTDQ